MMLKQSLNNKIISNKLHFSIAKDDHEDGDKANGHFILIETLEQRNDKRNELSEYWSLLCENPDESSDYFGCESFEDFEDIMERKMVKKYGDKYIPTI